jgi:phosphoribosylaminoimidazole-succinocarboxamide synthase
VNEAPLLTTKLEHFQAFHKGKVRESYDLGDNLLIIATDRISAYDQIMPTGIPGKGKVLNQLSAFWFGLTNSIVDNHLVSTDLESLPLLPAERERYAGRSMIVTKAERVDIECVVRGHLSGSAWSEYLRSGTVAGIRQRPDMSESEQFPVPIFTPAIKNDRGHDENISIEQLRDLHGADLAYRLEEASLALYSYAHDYALDRGIIIADTKFEFGFVSGKLIVIDEILTPDSSRFWDAAAFAPGSAQASFDKQYLRDWLTTSGWDREPPAPTLPADVVEGTIRRYDEALERLTGRQVELGSDNLLVDSGQRTEGVKAT